LQIKFDVLLGDFDHQTIEDIQAILPPHTLIVHTPDQNKTDLEKGLVILH
jgi:thiamine pyrophosphokinase